MPDFPSASTIVTENAGTPAGGTDLIWVAAPVHTQADLTPRIFGSADAIFELHGYSEGVSYAALHSARTRKPIIFTGLPINTPGAVGREDTSGNTGTSTTSLTVASYGCMTEHRGRVRVDVGGTVGSDQIVISYSLDGGLLWRSVRLGTATSYVIPYIGVTINFAAGDLKTGEIVHTWDGTGPVAAPADIDEAREKMAEQMALNRSLLVIGDVPNNSAALAIAASVKAYADANERFIYARVSLPDRLPRALLSRVSSRMTGNPALTFETDLGGDTITRAAGSWVADGFAVGDFITITGSASNNVTARIEGLTATVITLDASTLSAEGPKSNISVVAVPGIEFKEVGSTGDTITRSRGSWLDDGFRPGDVISVTGSASNDVTGPITNVTALVLTLGSTDLADEAIGSDDVVISTGQTKAEWMASLAAQFTIDGTPEIDLSIGRGKVQCPFLGFSIRRPAAWAASLREYQHDVHIATWRKSDGPTGFDLHGPNGELEEWDDRVDGNAATLNKFTSFRTFANGPRGVFIARSLTRASDSSLRVNTHHEATLNLARTYVQAATEEFIGRNLLLQENGRATSAALSQLESEVNSVLQNQMLTDKGEGPRCSGATWTASKDDVLNVPDPLLTGVLALNFNGTIVRVRTTIKISAGGQ